MDDEEREEIEETGGAGGFTEKHREVAEEHGGF